MRIDYIKANLKNIVLLAKEYREKIPVNVSQEMYEIIDTSHAGHTVSEYDRQFFNTTQEEKNLFFHQILLFAEQILLHLSKSLDRKRILEIDWDKLAELKATLSNRQLRVISDILEMLLIPETEKCRDRVGEDKLLERLIDTASKINPDSLPSLSELEEKENQEKLQLAS